MFLPEPLGDRGSMTFLHHFNLCPRSGFLYALHRREDAKTAAMVRGSAFHEMTRRATELAIDPDRGEVQVPAEVAKDLMNEVLAEMPVPVEEHDYLREMTWRWAVEESWDPAAVIALETLFWLEVDGFQVRGKIDRADLLDDGRRVVVKDWKTSRSAPSFEDVARKRSDGTLAAKGFQLIVYALALVFGVPVRVEDGEEVPDPFPLASRAERFDLELVFPAIELDDGKMLRRPMTLTRAEVDEYRESLRGLIRRVRAAERSGDWPAVVSDEACSICPAKSECPIPRELRDYHGLISTAEQAAEAAEVLDRAQALLSASREEIKRFCKAQDGVSLRFGNRVFEFVPVVRRRLDREGLIAAAERRAQFGDPFDPADYVKESSGTDFKARDLGPEDTSKEDS